MSNEGNVVNGMGNENTEYPEYLYKEIAALRQMLGQMTDQRDTAMREGKALAQQVAAVTLQRNEVQEELNEAEESESQLAGLIVKMRKAIGQLTAILQSCRDQGMSITGDGNATMVVNARAIAAEDWAWWRPITPDSLPKLGDEVLAGFRDQFGWVGFVATMTSTQGIYHPGFAPPTHWMPSPAPPAFTPHTGQANNGK